MNGLRLTFDFHRDGATEMRTILRSVKKAPLFKKVCGENHSQLQTTTTWTVLARASSASQLASGVC